MTPRQPIFNAPPVVMAMLAVLVLVHAGRQLLSEDQDQWFVLAAAFIPARYTMDPAMIPGGWVAVFTSPITHMLVHGDITHLLVNAAWLLAFGTAIARRMSAGRFLALCALCGVAGALAFLVFNWGSTASVIGISGAVSGLMGGAFRFFFSAVDRGAVALLRFEPRLVPRMGLRQALADRRIQFAIGLWLIANLLIAWGAAGLTQQAGIAWEAHVGGFLAGFLLFGLFDQGADPGEDEQLVS